MHQLYQKFYKNSGLTFFDWNNMLTDTTNKKKKKNTCYSKTTSFRH